jgi:hypothetical protein
LLAFELLHQLLRLLEMLLDGLRGLLSHLRELTRRLLLDDFQGGERIDVRADLAADEGFVKFSALLLLEFFLSHFQATLGNLLVDLLQLLGDVAAGGTVLLFRARGGILRRPLSVRILPRPLRVRLAGTPDPLSAALAGLPARDLLKLGDHLLMVLDQHLRKLFDLWVFGLLCAKSAELDLGLVLDQQAACQVLIELLALARLARAAITGTAFFRLQLLLLRGGRAFGLRLNTASFELPLAQLLGLLGRSVANKDKRRHGCQRA